MDELRHALLALLFVLSACTVRERVAYEDCVRSRCSPGHGSCRQIGEDPDAGLVGARVCTRPCTSDDECPSDERTGRPGRCMSLADGDHCLPTCESPYECSAPLACDASLGACVPEL